MTVTKIYFCDVCNSKCGSNNTLYQKYEWCCGYRGNTIRKEHLCEKCSKEINEVLLKTIRVLEKDRKMICNSCNGKGCWACNNTRYKK